MRSPGLAFRAHRCVLDRARWQRPRQLVGRRRTSWHDPGPIAGEGQAVPGAITAHSRFPEHIDVFWIGPRWHRPRQLVGRTLIGVPPPGRRLLQELLIGIVRCISIETLATAPWSAHCGHDWLNVRAAGARPERRHRTSACRPQTTAPDRHERRHRQVAPDRSLHRRVSQEARLSAPSSPCCADSAERACRRRWDSAEPGVSLSTVRSFALSQGNPLCAVLRTPRRIPAIGDRAPT